MEKLRQPRSIMLRMDIADFLDMANAYCGSAKALPPLLGRLHTIREQIGMCGLGSDGQLMADATSDSLDGYGARLVVWDVDMSIERVIEK